MPVFGIGATVDTQNAWQSCLLKPSGRPEGFIVSITFGAILPVVLEGLLYGLMYCIFYARRCLRSTDVQAIGMDSASMDVRAAEVARMNSRLKVAKTLSLAFMVTAFCSLSTPVIAALFPRYNQYPLLSLFLRVIVVMGYAVHPVGMSGFF
ncbi:hypothetical protein RvY_19116 [Ramazzottius varieornatus]|uniref:Uncharacterized protein n=1 Tax=Ramazzottius varieornatus TaxID=947166 RepID=A0A1D1W8B7_RAMVA|nr:hypothetical protein RvY_19116 [Ramazzottius varieornatus]